MYVWIICLRKYPRFKTPAGLRWKRPGGQKGRHFYFLVSTLYFGKCPTWKLQSTQGRDAVPFYSSTFGLIFGGAPNRRCMCLSTWKRKKTRPNCLYFYYECLKIKYKRPVLFQRTSWPLQQMRPRNLEMKGFVSPYQCPWAIPFPPLTPSLLIMLEALKTYKQIL